jgi:hypothetical protein
VSDIDIAVVDSLKALDLKWPIREADIARPARLVRFVPKFAVTMIPARDRRDVPLS